MRLVRVFLAALLLLVAFDAPAVVMPRFDKLEQALNLTPEQKEQYDVAVAATRRVVVAMTLAGMDLKDRLRQELAKPRPDLNILWEAKEILERSRSQRETARAEWLKLYGMLNDDQVAMIRSFLEARFDRLGELHELVLEILLGREPASKNKPYYW